MSIRSFRRARGRRLEREARRASALARRGRLLAGTTLTATALMATNAQAASNTYIVQTNADTSGGTCNPAPGTCDTLRDAINAANSDSGNSDTITFASTLTGGQTITVGSDLYLSNPDGMTISGPTGSGASPVTISGGGSSQIFVVDPTAVPATPTAEFAITGLTLTDGRSSSAGGAVEDVDYSSLPSPLQVPVSLANDTISDSSASDIGGGVATTAPLTLNHTTVTGNTASRGGGVAAYPAPDHYGKYGNLVALTGHTVVSHNHATSVGGGGISPYAGGGGVLAAGDALFISHSTVTGNTGVTGGGIAAASKYGTTVTHSTISGNSAEGLGGGVELYGFRIRPAHTQKYSPDNLYATTISHNHAEYGGGVQVYAMDPGNRVTINSSTIDRNTGKRFGGGIDFAGRVAAPFELVDSTISGNVANHGGGVSLGDGYNAPLTTTNPANGQRGSISFDNSTIARNTAGASGGGLFLSDYTQNGSSSKRSGEATLTSTIVAGNRAARKPNDLARVAGSTAGGFVAAFSLIQNPGTVPVAKQSTITGQNPLLGPLANNGGPTETMLPAKNSPVIDQGHNSLGLAFDQRGDPRTIDTSKPNPQGGDGTDIGAVELSARQVAAAMVAAAQVRPQGFDVTVNGKRLTRGSTPTVEVGKTPVGCEVRVGQLTSCVLEIRIDGYLVAAGGLSTKRPAGRLSTQVWSSKVVKRYLKAHFQHGINAKIYALSEGGQLQTALGTVRVVP